MSIILWLLAHKAVIGSIVGATCVIARAIVYLTPTPKDDAALAKVSPILKTLATVFGLDLKQGLNTSDLTPCDPPVDLPSRTPFKDLPPRGDGEWGGKPPTSL